MNKQTDYGKTNRYIKDELIDRLKTNKQTD